ncbi:MAG: hypothetical protein AB8H79_07815 [Myxococcota bacterium]
MPKTPPGRMGVEGGADCQPESFVPGEVAIVEDPSQPDYDKLADEAPGQWRGVKQTDWTDRFALNPGVTVTHWLFECERSGSDQVVEIRQDGARTALFTHILAAHIAPDRQRLYFYNRVRVGDEWLQKARVLDLTTMKSIELAPASCYAYGGITWLDGSFVTSTGWNEWDSHGDVCLWTDRGQLQSHVHYEQPQMMGLGAARIYPGSTPFMLVGSPRGCSVAAVDLRSGHIREQARAEGPGEDGFAACWTLPQVFDPGAFLTFGEAIAAPE